MAAKASSCGDPEPPSPIAYDRSVKLVPDISTYPPPPLARKGDPGVDDWIWHFSEGHGFALYQAFDTPDVRRRQIEARKLLTAKIDQGDLEAVRGVIEHLRTSNEAPFDRPLFWVIVNSDPGTWKGAYEAGHWHVIEYLVKDLGFSLTSTLPYMWYLPEAVSERASQTGNTEEMQRLLDMGWDINEMPGISHYRVQNSIWYPRGSPPGLSTFGGICMREDLVRWYLAHGGVASDVVMGEAARRSPVPILKILIEHGGKVEGSRLVAEAALADWWGSPDRLSVIKFLLDLGAPIDLPIRQHNPSQKLFDQLKGYTTNYDSMRSRYDGDKTAYQIAKLSHNHELKRLLLQRGASSRDPPEVKDSMFERAKLCIEDVSQKAVLLPKL